MSLKKILIIILFYNQYCLSSLPAPRYWTTRKSFDRNGEIIESPHHRFFVEATLPEGEEGVRKLQEIIRNLKKASWETGFPAPCLETDTCTINGNHIKIYMEVTKKDKSKKRSYDDILNLIRNPYQTFIVSRMENNGKTDPIKPRLYFRALLPHDASEADLTEALKQSPLVKTSQATTLNRFIALIKQPEIIRQTDGSILVTADITNPSGPCSNTTLYESFRNFIKR